VPGTSNNVNDPRSPCGRHLEILAPAAAWAEVGAWVFYADIVPQYHGSYHAFLRVHLTNPAAGAVQVRLLLSSTSSLVPSWRSEPRTVADTTDWLALDLGSLQFPGGAVTSGDTVHAIYLAIEVYGNTVSDLDIYDLILMPADEMLFDVYDNTPVAELSAGSTQGAQSTWIDVDGLTNPRHCPRALLRYDGWGTSAAEWQDQMARGYCYDGASPPQLTPHTRQRLWWLGFRYDETVPAWYSEPWAVRRVQLEDNDSYLLARGAE
jgi:hypothetical protein